MTASNRPALNGTARKGTALILGARSDIGRALAALCAEAGMGVILAARSAAGLEADVADLKVRTSAAVRAVECDVTAVDPAAFFDALGETPGLVVSMVGLLGDQARSERDPAYAAGVIAANFTGPALLLGEAASRMAAAGGGVVVGVSSVAGERGRKSNYVYGASKAGLTAFLSGLRHRFAGTKVRVVTVKPGFVDTAMTAGMKLPKPITAQPPEVARAILRAVQGGPETIYVRPVWRAIMTVVRTLPEPVFKRMKG